MPKPVDLDLLELALWQAYAKHVQKPNAERLLRAPTKDDIVDCQNLLKAVRNSWGLVCSGAVVGTFESIKLTAVNGMRNLHNWSDVTRNLLSSAVSIYMVWDREKITIKPETRQQLKVIRAVGLSIMREYDDIDR